MRLYSVVDWTALCTSRARICFPVRRRAGCEFWRSGRSSSVVTAPLSTSSYFFSFEADLNILARLGRFHSRHESSEQKLNTLQRLNQNELPNNEKRSSTRTHSVLDASTLQLSSRLLSRNFLGTEFLRRLRQRNIFLLFLAHYKGTASLLRLPASRGRFYCMS